MSIELFIINLAVQKCINKIKNFRKNYKNQLKLIKNNFVTKIKFLFEMYKYI